MSSYDVSDIQDYGSFRTILKVLPIDILAILSFKKNYLREFEP